MGRRRQPDQHAADRQAATQLLMNVTRRRSRLSKRALQGLYSFGSPDASDGGTFQRYERGGRTQLDDRMARQSIEAVLRGHLVPMDVIALENWPGAQRVLSVVTPLLCDLALGRPVSRLVAEDQLKRWRDARAALSHHIADQRLSVKDALEKAVTALEAASAALDALNRTRGEATHVGMISMPTAYFTSSPASAGEVCSSQRRSQDEHFKLKDWSAALATSLAEARIDAFAFPALDLPWAMPLDAQQRGALDDLYAQWRPEFDPPARCTVCGWPDIRCCCEFELLDTESTFELRERGAPSAVATEKGWAVKRRPLVLRPCPWADDSFYGLNVALDTALAMDKARSSQALATEP